MIPSSDWSLWHLTGSSRPSIVLCARRLLRYLVFQSAQTRQLPKSREEDVMLDVEGCKILIVGNCIFRRGVASIVRDVVPSASIAETFCFADARAQLNHCEFFAAIFDIDTGELNGPIGFRTLRVDCPHVILGVLSRTASAGDILSYLAAGVTGYVLEKSGQAEVERAFRAILNGSVYVPPNVIDPAACEREFAPPAPRRNGCYLTPRQDGVLRLLLKGHSNKEIARQLNLSPHTVKIHVGALLRCFAVPSRSSLAVAAAALHAEEIGHCNLLGSS
jgi:DNA-binding NarL/FixJ family response regulator